MVSWYGTDSLNFLKLSTLYPGDGVAPYSAPYGEATSERRTSLRLQADVEGERFH